MYWCFRKKYKSVSSKIAHHWQFEEISHRCICREGLKMYYLCHCHGYFLSREMRDDDRQSSPKKKKKKMRYFFSYSVLSIFFYFWPLLFYVPYVLYVLRAFIYPQTNRWQGEERKERGETRRTRVSCEREISVQQSWSKWPKYMPAWSVKKGIEQNEIVDGDGRDTLDILPFLVLCLLVWYLSYTSIVQVCPRQSPACLLLLLLFISRDLPVQGEWRRGREKERVGRETTRNEGCCVFLSLSLWG